MLPRLIQPSFAGGELAPALHGRVDLAKYQVGLRTAKNVICLAQGGVQNRAGTEFVAQAGDESAAVRLIPFIFSVTQAYALEFGDQYMRVIKDGGQVLETAQNITGVTQASPGVVTITAHGLSNGDEVYITGVGGMTELNGRNFVVAGAATDTFTLVDLYGDAVDTTGFTAYTSGGTAARVYQIATPYAAADLRAIRFAQSADVLYLTHPDYAVRKLSRTSETSWSLDTVTFGTSQAAPTSASASYVGSLPGTTTTGNYRITAIDDDTGEESLVSNTATETIPTEATWPSGDYVNITWTAASGADRYRVYKEDNGIYGYIGGTEGVSFRDDNIVPDLGQTPQKAVSPFPSTDNYPTAVTFFEQRLVFGATNNNPATIDASQTALFENFNVSVPSKATDAVSFALNAQQLNTIQHLVPMSALIAFTSSAEWAIDGGSESDVITPSTIRARPQSYRGTGTLRPITVGDTVLYLQERGNVVRDLLYEFQTDGYRGTDLSIMARHLFDGFDTLEWAYAQAPNSVVWAVRDDGVCLALTYLREHAVYAWTRQVTDGEFESVCTIPEGDEDAVYFVVKRTIGAATKRYVERLHTRRFSDVTGAFFVDSGLTYSGTATDSVTGLHHLEGETVNALCDGNVVRGLTVADGAVAFSSEFETIHVGLPYTSDIETLDIDLASRDTGTAQGRKKRVGRVVARVEDTRGIFYGPASDNLVEYKQRAGEAWGDPIALYTGDMTFAMPPAWNGNGRVFLRQTDPLPMTILALMPDIVVGG